MKTNILLSLATTVIFHSKVQADWQYRSRPDLSPPRLNITIPASSDVDDGYIFIAPYRGFIQSEGLDGPEQPGAYIFRNDGDLVWSSVGTLDGWVGNFQVTQWRGMDVLQAFTGTLDSFHGHGYGHPTILNNQYESIREVRCAGPRIISIHEFSIVNQTSALVEIYQPTAMDLSPYGGADEQNWIADGIVQEFDIETEELLFEWHSLDHVDPTYSAISLTSGDAFNGVNSSVAWDYFHTNSVDKDDQGNYLVSARHMSTIYKINGTSGEIIWKLGGKQPDFSYSSEVEFAYQHDARFRHRSEDGTIEVISFFNNAARSNGHRGGGLDHISDYSTAKIVRLNTSDWTASIIHALVHPDKLLTTSQGNVQTLPNGNVFVNWGQSGVVTEYRVNDSEPIFNAYLDSGSIGVGVQSYRGFRFKWKGHPIQTPAIAVFTDPQTITLTTVYVSWNGDTNTVAWRFYAVSDFEGNNRSHSRYLLGEAKKVSFETAFKFSSSRYAGRDDKVIYAEAIDKNGQILSCTDTAVAQSDLRSTKNPSGHRNGGESQQVLIGDL